MATPTASSAGGKSRVGPDSAIPGPHARREKDPSRGHLPLGRRPRGGFRPGEESPLLRPPRHGVRDGAQGSPLLDRERSLPRGLRRQGGIRRPSPPSGDDPAAPPRAGLSRLLQADGSLYVSPHPPRVRPVEPPRPEGARRARG